VKNLSQYFLIDLIYKFNLFAIISEGTRTNLDMETASQAGSYDDHDINVDVAGNSVNQINRRPAESQREIKEKCNICLEEVNVNQMHERLCSPHAYCYTCLHKRLCSHHKYCFSCMAKHVEVKLTTQDGVPKCPDRWCNSELTKNECEKFLSSKWLEIFIKRVEEAKIPYSKRVYCPYYNCSALMHRDECPEARTECQECHRLICIECGVPWHMGMSCQEYTSQLCAADAELHLLAENNQWKRCPECKHMIELSEGCMEMACRYCIS
jgi:hypothetical protein